MSFCMKCGKELKDGEVCDCKAPDSVEGIDVNNAGSSAAAVESKKSIPYVSEILGIFKNSISRNTVKQVSLSAKENSILWVFVMLIESFINSLAITIIVRSAARKLMSAALGMATDFLYGESTVSVSKLLSNIGLGFFGLFFRIFIMGIAIFFITSGLIYVLIKLSRKQCSFNNAANMVSTAAIPLTFLSIISFIISFILPQAALLILIIALVSVLILMYLGIQKLDKFTESPFWIYIAFIFVLLIVSFFAVKLLMPSIKLDQIFSGIF